MDYTIEYDKTLNACVVQVNGIHRRPYDSHKLMQISSEFGIKNNCAQFLFDMRKAELVYTTMGSYDTAINPEKSGFNNLFKVAAVYASNLPDHKFMENVAVNRGAAGFRVFEDIQEARNWLLPVISFLIPESTI